MKVDDPDLLDIVGSIKLLSTYSKVSVGQDCLEVVKKIVESCENAQDTDFLKIDIYSSLSKNVGSCLYETAKICNTQLQKAIMDCKNHRPLLNILNADYPNYPGSGKTNVQLAFEENLAE